MGQAAVSFEKKTATVQYDPARVTPAQMIAAIDAIGFRASLRELPTDQRFQGQGTVVGVDLQKGTVTLDDGTSVTKGLVIFERVAGGEPITARGQISADGSYELSTHKPGDGVPAGKYKVVLNSMDLSDVPDEAKNLPYNTKYLSLATSGLEVEVTTGPNDIPLKLERPAKKARR